MKKVLYTIGFLVIVYSCNEAASKSEKPAVEDSLTYYPPTPKKLEKAAFRHYYRELSSFFDSMLLRRGFNGGILVAKDGQVIYEKYQGFEDLRSKKDSLTDSSALHIASTSKTFTGIAVLRLVQENKLSLQDSIQQFFPNLPYPGITVKMLLNHRSGLPNYLHFINNKNWKTREYVTNADVLNFLYTEKPTRANNPDRRFSYCNTNFVLLAMIIEKVSGASYPDYIRQKFFGPLQMTHSFVFTVSDTLKVNPSFKHNSAVWDNDIFEGTYGDKNIYTTPQDLLKWDQALYTDQLINKSLMDSAFTPFSNERPSIHNYGLGFRMLNFPNGKKVIYHFGKWHGFNAAFARLTDEKVTIIILGNKYNRSIYSAANQSYDIFGHYRDKDGSKEDEETESNEQTPVRKEK